MASWAIAPSIGLRNCSSLGEAGGRALPLSSTSTDSGVSSPKPPSGWDVGSANTKGSGGTLRANGLVEIRRVMESQAVLIVNRAAYRLKADIVRNAIHALRRQIEAHTGTESTQP